MGDIWIVTGFFYDRANGKVFIFQSTMVGRDIDVVTGQQPDAHPGSFFAIQEHLQRTFGGGGSGGTGRKSCAELFFHRSLIQFKRQMTEDR